MIKRMGANRRHRRYRLTPCDQELLDRLSVQGRSPASAAGALGVPQAAVDQLVHGGTGTKRGVDTMSEALAAYRSSRERGAA